MEVRGAVCVCARVCVVCEWNCVWNVEQCVELCVRESVCGIVCGIVCVLCVLYVTGGGGAEGVGRLGCGVYGLLLVAAWVCFFLCMAGTTLMRSLLFFVAYRAPHSPSFGRLRVCGRLYPVGGPGACKGWAAARAAAPRHAFDGPAAAVDGAVLAPGPQGPATLHRNRSPAAGRRGQSGAG
jgi:hypothetical protein